MHHSLDRVHSVCRDVPRLPRRQRYELPVGLAVGEELDAHSALHHDGAVITRVRVGWLG
jgi:hypothetical protein